VGASASHNPMGLYVLFQEYLYLFDFTFSTIILFLSQCNLGKLICTLSFLTICFGPTWPSSGVSSYAETVKLY
jgi:hypothetical protein